MAQTALEAVLGFIPGVGQALAARDIERARRANDPAAAAMAATEFVPFGRMLGGMRRGGPIMSELDVYHGTPHRFEPTEANPLGEFDASKIGTGEGAQAFGHGIYYAENPGVAKSYQFVNAKIDPDTVTYNGKSMQSLYDAAMRKQTAAHRLKDEKSIQKANAELAFWEQMMVSNHPDQVIADVMANPEDWPEYTQFVKGLDRAKFKNVEQAGNLYKADLPDEMIDRMLDYDNPLTQQPKNVQAALAKLGDPQEKLDAYDDALLKALFENAADPGSVPRNPSGADILKKLENQYGRKGASDYLRELGIPGIRYLDAGSRGQGGSGTRNFVVFPGEEKKVKILERK
jgi:hypothetical protein